MPLHFDRSKEEGEGEDEDPDTENEDYNQTTAVYAGNGQTGLLNIALLRVELYDNKEGYLKQILQLPDDVMLEHMFNFAFANNTWWLFDKTERTWVGYR